MFEFFLRTFTVGLGIDLGTANILVHKEGEGIVVCAPSVVAVRKSTGEVLAVGEEAAKMVGKTPEDIVAARPLREGVIADFEMTEKMLRYFIEKVVPRRGILRPRVEAVIGVPSGITPVEERAVVDSAMKAGCYRVWLIKEPMAAAIGADLPVESPVGNMVVDIGGGTTEVAVISLGGIVVEESIRVAGDAMDRAIVEYIRNHYDVEISERVAEQLKKEIGSASDVFEEEKVRTVRGYYVARRLPYEIEVSSTDIRKALNGPVTLIEQAVLRALERTRPDLCDDLAERGITLVGGGALLPGLDVRLHEATGLPVRRAENPLEVVVYGAAKYLEVLRKHRNHLGSLPI